MSPYENLLSSGMLDAELVNAFISAHERESASQLEMLTETHHLQQELVAKNEMIDSQVGILFTLQRCVVPFNL